MAILVLPAMVVLADLRTPNPPGWYDPDGVATGEDWHYRVPVTLPASSSVNSTAKVNVNFATLMTQLGIGGTFDPNSVRVVRPNGALANVQEFTDRIFSDATDAANNARGEVKWIVEDGGAQTYYIYFDITQNGVKSGNLQTPINGNFERGATGSISPTQWTGARTNVNFDAAVRPNETVSVTNNGGANETRNTDGSPNTGSFSYLLGARTNNEPAGGFGGTLIRTIAVPATNPGNITIRYRVEGWDSSANGSTTQWDWLDIALLGATTPQIVGPAAGNYTTFPFSSNLGTGQASGTTSGYGQYNGWDTNTAGVHQSGMTIAPQSEPWFTRTVSLAAFAGQNVTLRIRSRHATTYKNWYHIDDVEWSVVNGTLGTAEAFGIALSSPVDTSVTGPGQALTITAQVDANPTAATNPVTANVYDDGGTLVASGIILYNDGTHGDTVAGDAIWTNDNSVPAQPTYTIPLSATNGTGWIVRVFAKDASTSTIGAQNGLAHRNGLPTTEIEANYWNIDEITFDVAEADLSVTKISSILNDPVNGAANPKAIPGATIEYCVLISNAGNAVATSISATDTIPGNVSYVSGSMNSGNNCGSASTPEDDNASGADESDPIGASITGATMTITNASLSASSAMALTYRVTVD
ncbi:MAG: DUF11 domain-containing protein [Parasphingorhabdus sp.]